MQNLVKSHEILRKMSLVMMLVSLLMSLGTVTDPGFFEIKGTNLKDWGANLLFWPFFPKDCMKLKKYWNVCVPSAP